MSAFELRAAPAAREVVKPPLRMMTPKRRMRYLSERGVEILEPGRDRFVTDHPTVRGNPHLFRPVLNLCHPRAREVQALERELAEIERKLRTAPATATARATRARSRSRWLPPEPWRLPSSNWRLPCRIKLDS